MTSSISSSLPEFTSLSLQIAELESESVSTLLSGEDTSISSFTMDVCAAQSDLCSISTVAKSLSTAAETAESSGVSDDAIDNLRAFVAQLQEEEYDTPTILGYLDQAEALAQSDSDQFEEIFSDFDSTETTIASLEALEDS